MTKSKIKAELRRSACEDKDPYHGVLSDVFWRVLRFTVPGERMYQTTPDDIRTLYLLVAEAL